MPEITAGDDEGGSPITSYALYWNGGGASTTYTELIGETSANMVRTFFKNSGITPSETYKFKYKVKNIYGFSGESPILTVLAAKEPDAPAFPSTTLIGTDVTIDWAVPANVHGDAVIKYSVLIKSSTGDWYEDLTDCDMSLSASTDCTIPMLTFSQSPFNLPEGALIEAKVAAGNTIGYGPYSTENTAGETVLTVPQAPATPTNGALTSHTQIEIDWVALTTSTETGGLAIDSYNLEWWDNGILIASWEELVGETTPFLATTHLQIPDVVAGTTYYFRLRAQNALGWGDYSLELEVLAASIPTTLLPVTTLDNADTTVNIAWDPPTENGSPITEYKILFLESDGVTYTEDATCDGTDATIIANRYCNVPMSVFLASPYNLVHPDLIVATVASKNEIGWSLYSLDNGAGPLA